MAGPPRARRDCRCPRARHQHGTKQAYDLDGCGCSPCRAAHRADRNARRRLIAYGRWNRFVPSIGTARRLQALQACGWTLAELGRRLGVSSTAVMRLRDQQHGRAHVATARRVQELYDELWDVPPPERTQWRRAQTLARAQGWLPPLAWDDDTIDDPRACPQVRTQSVDDIDEIAVSRAMHGDSRAKLTVAERSEAVRRLTAWGYSAREIAERLGISDRTVTRRRSAA